MKRRAIPEQNMMTDFSHTSGSFSEMSSSIHEPFQKAAATWETLFPPIRVIIWTSTLWKDVLDKDNIDNALLNAIIALKILDVTIWTFNVFESKALALKI